MPSANAAGARGLVLVNKKTCHRVWGGYPLSVDTEHSQVWAAVYAAVITKVDTPARARSVADRAVLEFRASDCIGKFVQVPTKDRSGVETVEVHEAHVESVDGRYEIFMRGSDPDHWFSYDEFWDVGINSL